MADRNRTQKTLSMLLPVGMLGVSAILASAQAMPSKKADDKAADPLKPDVAARLQEIRSSVSALDGQAPVEADFLLAQWVNIGGGGGAGIGWRNGGWGNGGWGNGGWRNAGWANGGWGNGGWRNGWGNGPRPPWGNGGWHNFWHNW